MLLNPHCLPQCQWSNPDESGENWSLPFRNYMRIITYHNYTLYHHRFIIGIHLFFIIIIVLQPALRSNPLLVGFVKHHVFACLCSPQCSFKYLAPWPNFLLPPFALNNFRFQTKAGIPNWQPSIRDTGPFYKRFMIHHLIYQFKCDWIPLNHLVTVVWIL